MLYLYYSLHHKNRAVALSTSPKIPRRVTVVEVNSLFRQHGARHAYSIRVLKIIACLNRDNTFGKVSETIAATFVFQFNAYLRLHINAFKFDRLPITNGLPKWGQS